MNPWSLLAGMLGALLGLLLVTNLVIEDAWSARNERKKRVERCEKTVTEIRAARNHHEAFQGEIARLAEEHGELQSRFPIVDLEATIAELATSFELDVLEDGSVSDLPLDPDFEQLSATFHLDGETDSILAFSEAALAGEASPLFVLAQRFEAEGPGWPPPRARLSIQVISYSGQPSDERRAQPAPPPE